MIVSSQVKSNEFPDSPWERYKVRYVDDPDGDYYHGPWELHEPDLLRNQCQIDGDSRDKLLYLISRLERSIFKTQVCLYPICWNILHNHVLETFIIEPMSHQDSIENEILQMLQDRYGFGKLNEVAQKMDFLNRYSSLLQIILFSGPTSVLRDFGTIKGRI